MSVGYFFFIPFFLMLLLGIAVLVIVQTVRQRSGVKAMLMGLAVILFGIALILGSSSDLLWMEYLIVLLGLAEVIVGFYLRG